MKTIIRREQVTRKDQEDTKLPTPYEEYFDYRNVGNQLCMYGFQECTYTGEYTFKTRWITRAEFERRVKIEEPANVFYQECFKEHADKIRELKAQLAKQESAVRGLVEALEHYRAIEDETGIANRALKAYQESRGK